MNTGELTSGQSMCAALSHFYSKCRQLKTQNYSTTAEISLAHRICDGSDKHLLQVRVGGLVASLWCYQDGRLVAESEVTGGYWELSSPSSSSGPSQGEQLCAIMCSWYDTWILPVVDTCLSSGPKATGLTNIIGISEFLSQNRHFLHVSWLSQAFCHSYRKLANTWLFYTQVPGIIQHPRATIILCFSLWLCHFETATDVVLYRI